LFSILRKALASAFHVVGWQDAADLRKEPS
jgi:hypothetical protein